MDKNKILNKINRRFRNLQELMDWELSYFKEPDDCGMMMMNEGNWVCIFQVLKNLFNFFFLISERREM